jgi:hypothetical protein
VHCPRHSHALDPCCLVAATSALAFLLLHTAPVGAADRKQSNGSLESRSGGPVRGTLSGTLLHQAQATTTWYLYPNACNDRYTNTWSPATSIVADSLNSYSTVTQNHGYPREDQSLRERLWHVTDGSDTPVGEYDPILNGTRSLWCGKYDAVWAVRVGYPNRAYSILYIDTGAHTGTWNLSWTQNVATELNYDYLYVIGGSGGAADPIGNNRAILDQIVSTGTDAAGSLLVTMTGSQTTALLAAYAAPPGVTATGAGAGDPATVAFVLSGIPAAHRAVYVVLVSDPGHASQDGLSPFGHGAILDDIASSDNGPIYTDQTPVGGTDSYSGDVILGTPSSPIVSSRVPPGAGELWRLAQGNLLPTADVCAPQKAVATDKIFEAGDISHYTIPNTIASIHTCTFPVPAGTASVLAVWGEYLDLPRHAGFVQHVDFRIHRNGAWWPWTPALPGRSMKVWGLEAWTTDAAEITEAVQADSVQLRYTLECVNALAVNGVNCTPVSYGFLLDDLRLQVTTGTPGPTFRAFVGGVAQSMFVDGTFAGSANCTAPQIAAGECWPGIRGSALTLAQGGLRDNVNSPLGDSITVSIPSGLRRGGMGINWRYGFASSVAMSGVGGIVISRLNGAYNPAHDAPRVIYRLFDPATKTWSPWDSSELDANAVAITGTDTSLVDSEFRLNWPPRDKYYVNFGSPDIGPNADANLPGYPAWTLNGKAKYSQVRFLPRGTRLQYYLKAVDINGAVTYQFSSEYAGLEVEDLPYLPGSSVKAPDIIEFDVLPRAYPPGTAGTLAAGRTDALILNLDGAYSAWSNRYDPVTQALRAMGVRADRYRFLQGLGEGANIGGHELPAQRLDRLGNHFPNLYEYGIVDSLAAAYRILIQSSHLRTWTVFEEQDAILTEGWWNTPTAPGLNSGDRCILGTGDDLFHLLLNASTVFPQYAQQVSLAQNVFGVASVINAWTNPMNRQYPTIDDRFAGGGPGLAAPGTFTYPIDGGCPYQNRFDGLTKIGSADAQNAVFYPDGVTEVAGIARMSEKDTPTTDHDRNKALAYGFSIQFIRKAGFPTNAAGYPETGVENRMRVLYKFLTSCRRNTASVTTPCWPCPSSPSEMVSNWATATGFDTATYGDLYPIQDFTMATGIQEPAPGVPAFVNALSQNRPNPFNPETVIPYSISSDGRVAIRIFDVAGRLVRTLVDARQQAGPHVVRWDGRADKGRPLAAGIYFTTIFYPDGTTSARKMTILR